MWEIPIALAGLIAGASFADNKKAKIFGLIKRDLVWPIAGGLGLLGGIMWYQQQKDEAPELIGMADPFDEDAYVDPEVAFRQKQFDNDFRINVLGPQLMGVVDPVRLGEEARMGQEPYFKWGGRQLLITREWPAGAQIPVTDPSIHDIPGLPTVSVGEQIDRRIWRG